MLPGFEPDPLVQLTPLPYVHPTAERMNRGKAATPRTTLGSVYTPPDLAAWVAMELTSHLDLSKPLVVLDPACGQGALLSAIHEATDGAAQLAGIDVDTEAVSQARLLLPDSTQLIVADTLVLAQRQPSEVTTCIARAVLGRQVDAVIANPPWGAQLPHSRPRLQELGYKLAQGQFDSFDLFVELALGLVAEGGVLAFIIPDALFAPEHMALRRLLVESTQLLLIARLGEGFFDGVYRGTAVLLCRKEQPPLDWAVDCFRLNKTWRKRLLSDDTTLTEARKTLSHSVPQARFADDPEVRFDIDLQEQERAHITQLECSRMPWTRWLVSARGVELSKYGEIVYCPHCGIAHPTPRVARAVICELCGGPYDNGNARRGRIVEPLRAPSNDWRPLIVGEDVDRYHTSPSRQIRLGVIGINYKTPESFQVRKLLIRKTGIGIKAAIDESGSYTNQVVFHYYAPPGLPAPAFLLDYLLGVLCSRVLLAYHLKRMGENEWRSHPYITQRTISSLPIPDIQPGTWQWAQAQAIADAVADRRLVYQHDSEEDLRVERLVAGLFDLDDEGCGWVIRVLEEAEGLEPIRSLWVSDPRLLKPVRVQ